MAQLTMYPAKAGSKRTTLTADLAADGTQAFVGDLSAFPPAPNLVTFKSDETVWETCLYTEKSAESGTGYLTITRSGEGHDSSASGAALSWSSGASAFRSPTGLDHDRFKANIEDLAANKQNLDATLTALAGLTTAANKLPYATGEDAFDVCDFTPLGRSLVGSTTESAVRNLIAAASSTTATQDIYVDSAATGAGTGVDWDNAFTTIQAAVDSLPAVINHEITIIVRKSSDSYAAATLQRIVGNGSITICGEYYWKNTVASAGSAAGKFNLNASDSGVQAGDKILLMKYSGAVGSTSPDDAFIDTIASVDGTEVTLTNRITDSFTTSWYYVIVRSEVAQINVVSSNNVYIMGLYLKNTTDIPIAFTNVVDPRLQYSICDTTTNTTVLVKNSQITTTGAFNFVGIICGASQNNALMFTMTNAGYGVSLTNIAVLSGAVAYGSGRGHIYGYNSVISIYMAFIKGQVGGTADGVFVYGGTLQVVSSKIDGYNASNKLPNGIRAINGGRGITSDVTFGANVTTQKSPANWAATTDGSYVS